MRVIATAAIAALLGAAASAIELRSMAVVDVDANVDANANTNSDMECVCDAEAAAEAAAEAEFIKYKGDLATLYEETSDIKSFFNKVFSTDPSESVMAGFHGQKAGKAKMPKIPKLPDSERGKPNMFVRSFECCPASGERADGSLGRAKLAVLDEVYPSDC